MSPEPGQSPGPFARGSSPIDWCEPNYVLTSIIAEFWNTVSNISFLLLVPLVAYLFRQYGTYISRACHLVWLLLFVVGISSAYFHATLSLAGQLLDEFGILWVISASLALWTPTRILPRFLNKNIKAFQIFILVLTVIGTLLGCVWPYINAMILISFGLPISIILMTEIKRSDDQRLKSLGLRTTGLWMIAVTIWVSDRSMCGMWERLKFPYLHSIWHVLVVYACYHAIVVFAYRHTETEYGDLKPSLRFFPSDMWPRVGVAYITFHSPRPVTKAKGLCKLL